MKLMTQFQIVKTLCVFLKRQLIIHLKLLIKKIITKTYYLNYKTVDKKEKLTLNNFIKKTKIFFKSNQFQFLY